MKLLLSPTPNIFQFSGGLGTLTSKSYSTTLMVTFRGGEEPPLGVPVIKQTPSNRVYAVTSTI